MLVALLCLSCLAIDEARADKGGALFPAIKTGNLAAVKDLLAKDRRLAWLPDGLQITPLHMAAFWGQKDIASLLISQGARIDTRDRDGRTPLDIARGQGDREMEKLLLLSLPDRRQGTPGTSEFLEGVVTGMVDAAGKREILMGAHVFAVDDKTRFRPLSWRPACRDHVRIWHGDGRAITIELKKP
jgi:ankyrin repeat protein